MNKSDMKREMSVKPTDRICARELIGLNYKVEEIENSKGLGLNVTWAEVIT